MVESGPWTPGQVSFLLAFAPIFIAWVYSEILEYKKSSPPSKVHSDSNLVELGNEATKEDERAVLLEGGQAKSASVKFQNGSVRSNLVRLLMQFSSHCAKFQMPCRSEFGTILIYFYLCDRTNLFAESKKEHLHYDVVKSTDSELKKATVQINVYKQHRQTIQYLKPHEHGKLSQVELLVVDEAAAIPLPIVKSLLGPYLVFLSSTVNGYEGTGRSLSLKLLHQLESQSRISMQSTDGPKSGMLFKKIELNESIRYASGDPIESWLSSLLCLDVAKSIPNISRLPNPRECDLYYVNRDTLFSYHKESEMFLQRMMALYVASHYKNAPNDLQLMADAPAHHLFVLLGPIDESKNQLPDILCVVQVCLEGQISRKSSMKSLSEGRQPFGDQIPWKFCEQFQDDVFPSLSGARIVRIAVHPNALGLGYGSTAVELLTRYYEGQMTKFAEVDEEETEEHKFNVTEAAEKVSLLEENIKPRANLPPLLVHLHERPPEKLHYLGVSFGLTYDLFRFWKKHNFNPFYVGHIPSAVSILLSHIISWFSTLAILQDVSIWIDL